MSLMKCCTLLDVKLHWAQCVKSNYNRMEPFPIGKIWTTQIVSNLKVWATINGSHLARGPTSSPVLIKWWNSELTLATNFGSHAQTVTKFGGPILATKFGFVPDCLFKIKVTIPRGQWVKCDVPFQMKLYLLVALHPAAQRQVGVYVDWTILGSVAETCWHAATPDTSHDMPDSRSMEGHKTGTAKFAMMKSEGKQWIKLNSYRKINPLVTMKNAF